jgi:hypothetical protein
MIALKDTAVAAYSTYRESNHVLVKVSSVKDGVTTFRGYGWADPRYLESWAARWAGHYGPGSTVVLMPTTLEKEV